MKYIFRYALLANFTNRQQQITPEQLTEALRVAKFSLAGKNLEELIQQSNSCVQLLLRNNDKREVDAVVAEAFPRVSEAELADLSAIWESEKHLIFKKMVADNSKSTHPYAGVAWSVRNSISARNGSTQNTKTVSIKLRDGEGEVQVHCNRAQFQVLSQRLSSAQTFLSELFSNQ